MVKSLGDYNKEKSSSADLKNIKWSKKNIQDSDKPKKKNRKKIPPTNIIINKNQRIENTTERIFIIEKESDENKSKNKIKKKKFEKSSVTNSKIEPGFRRPGR